MNDEAIATFNRLSTKEKEGVLSILTPEARGFIMANQIIAAAGEGFKQLPKPKLSLEKKRTHR